MTNQFSKDDAWTLVDALRAAGVEASVDARDYVTEENTVGQRYSVRAVLVDTRHGNTVVRTLTSMVDVPEIVRDMQRDLKERAKSTQARRRTQRAADRS